MERQVFQTDSRRRWSRFKWTMRFFVTIIVLLVTQLSQVNNPRYIGA